LDVFRIFAETKPLMFMNPKQEVIQTQAPKTVEELKKLFAPVKQLKVKHKAKLSFLDKLAVAITIRVGSMGFFLIIFGWTVLWLGWNTLEPAGWRFDAYPGFVLWLFISNMIQIFLMPLIMVGQNLQGQYAEVRAEADFEINQKAEFEIENILLHLEKQQALMLEILKKLDEKSKT
jgi:uncharacterized membrane protein